MTQTTGSLVAGTVRGLADHLENAGYSYPSIFYVKGNPDAVLTAVAGSDIAVDATNGKYYIAKTTGGSTWYSLGSTT
jgi:hypothetical protein